MSIFTKALQLFKHPEATQAAKAAVPAVDPALITRTAALQRRIDTKAVQAEAHLSAARNIFAHYETRLTRSEQAVRLAKDSLKRHDRGSPAMEAQRSADGLWVDPRLRMGVRNALSDHGVQANRLFNHQLHGVPARNLGQAEQLLSEARDIAFRNRDVALNTSGTYDNLAELDRLQGVSRDLDSRARMLHGDIFGSHAVMREVLPDGTVVHRNALFTYPY